MIEGYGPSVSMGILSIGLGWMAQTLMHVWFCAWRPSWHVGQLCTNCLASCRNCGQFVPFVSSDACCVISAMVCSTPLSVREGMCETVQ